MSPMQHPFTGAVNGIEEPIEKNGSANDGSPQEDAQSRCRDRPIHANRHMRVVCIGAGASGIYLAYKLAHYFTDFTLDVYEKNVDVGGTWFENRYPGCACDVPSHTYTYSFEPKWDWSANYASSSEICEYFSNFVNKYRLRQYISCNHKVVGSHWEEEKSEWVVQVEPSTGAVFEKRCDFLINAAGILNAWKWPAIPDLHSFQGSLVHSANWDSSLDLTGKRVGLIGNGSSGIQILPQVQRVAKHVTAFIRSPTWVNPSRNMQYHKYTDEEKLQFRDGPGVHLQLRKQTEFVMSSYFPLFIQGSLGQETALQAVKGLMKQKINNDTLAEKLIPKFAVGCRRFTPGPNYLESLTLPNVTPICREIAHVTPRGCVTEDGQEHVLDALICATGFDTSFKPRFPVIGRNGVSLTEFWKTEPRSYLGLAVHGFPNYFVFLGPNCPIGNGPIVISIEAQGCYFAEFMNRWQKEDIRTFDPKLAAVDDFQEQKDLLMQRTVWNSSCQSWYKDRVSGKITALWPGSTLHYLEALAKPRYDDFDVTYACRNRFAYLGDGLSQAELRPQGDLTYYIREKDRGELLSRTLMSTYNAKDSVSRLSVPLGATIL